jgi:hypothetical protein
MHKHMRHEIYQRTQSPSKGYKFENILLQGPHTDWKPQLDEQKIFAGHVIGWDRNKINRDMKA